MPELFDKPYSNVKAGDLSPYFDKAGKCLRHEDNELWLLIAVHPAFAAAVRAVYRARPKVVMEAHLRELADEVYQAPETAEEWHRLHVVGRWFLRNYSFGNAWHFYGRLIEEGLSKIGVLAVELLMPRLAVSVGIGMLAICGSSPWGFFSALHATARHWLIGGCLGFASLYRFVDVTKRCSRGGWTRLVRTVGLTAYGWFWGFGLVWGFAILLHISDEQKWSDMVLAQYRCMLPSIGVAVGVVLQELWEERPISEPI